MSRSKTSEGAQSAHGYGLHLLDVLSYPRVRKSTGQRRFVFHGPSVWNSLLCNSARKQFVTESVQGAA